MRNRSISTGVAIAAAGAMALAGCASGTTGAEATTTLTIAETNSFTSFNPITSNGNTDINSKVITYPTRSWFYYIDGSSFAAGDPGVNQDESFGTYEVVTSDPLVVKYTLNKGLTWSDGEAITADDLLLAWATQSGHYNSPGADAESSDDDVSYFDFAGDTGTLGLSAFPEVSDDNLSMTLTYSQPAADWEIALQADVPAHVVAAHAGLEDAAALTALLTKLADTAPTAAEADEELAAVAEFWNTGYDSTTLPDDSDLYVSSGPYIVSEVTENESVTLVPNEEYQGDLTAQLDQIVMRTVPDATAAVQALKNGEVDVISPQPSADTLKALDQLTGVTVHQDNQLAYDHLDLTFTNGGPFDPATYGGDAAKAEKVRQAFLLTVPRQSILDAIVTPLSPEAEVLNSQLFVPAQSAYEDVTAANGSAAYPAEPDIAAAKALLAEAGVTAPTVRILYNIDNPNRVNAYTLIAKSATDAGFTIVDQGDAEWGSRLGDGSYDATIFGWVNPGVGVSGTPQIFGSAGGGNFNGYSNAEIDALCDELLVTLDSEDQTAIQEKIDPLIWADAYGLPLFQSVGIDAVADRVGGIDVYNPNQAGVWWNVWEWTVTD